MCINGNAPPPYKLYSRGLRPLAGLSHLPEFCKFIINVHKLLFPLMEIDRKLPEMPLLHISHISEITYLHIYHIFEFVYLPYFQLDTADCCTCQSNFPEIFLSNVTEEIAT